MINKNKYIREFQHLMLKDYTATKITLYMAVQSAGEGYDPYEGNTTATNLNPKTIRAYIHAVTPQQLVYKQYGLINTGAIEIVTEDKYLNWFKIANKIVVNDVDYRIMRRGNADGTTSNPRGTILAERAFRMVKIVLVRND